MGNRKVTHSEVFQADCETMFSMLITPSAIRGWWSVSSAIVIAEQGGVYALAWGEDEDNPDASSVGEILVFEPGKLFVIGNYRYSVAGGKHPFSIADMQVRFELEAEDMGTRLTVHNTGFPDEPVADDFYNGCIQGWRDTFAGIRKFLSE